MRRALPPLIILCAIAIPSPARAQYSYVWPSYSSPSLLAYGQLIGYTPQLISRELNGVTLAGAQLDSRSVASVSYSSARFDGRPARRVFLSASHLTVVDADGRVRKGARVAGVHFDAAVEGGGTVELRVDGVTRYADKAHKHLVSYEVSYRTAAGWKPLCGTDNGAPVRAIALRGRWDLSQGTSTGGDYIDDVNAFTFGCEDLVVGKCVLAGYEPWRRVLQCHTTGHGKRCALTTLRQHHQACTRVLRADYCGDGTAHTVDGTEISMYDSLGVRVDGTSWDIEAVWDADGARCVRQARHGALPTCANALYDAKCGDAPTAGALLVTELPTSN